MGTGRKPFHLYSRTVGSLRRHTAPQSVVKLGEKGSIEVNQVKTKAFISNYQLQALLNWMKKKQDK